MVSPAIDSTKAYLTSPGAHENHGLTKRSDLLVDHEKKKMKNKNKNKKTQSPIPFCKAADTLLRFNNIPKAVNALRPDIGRWWAHWYVPGGRSLPCIMGD